MVMGKRKRKVGTETKSNKSSVNKSLQFEDDEPRAKKSKLEEAKQSLLKTASTKQFDPGPSGSLSRPQKRKRESDSDSEVGSGVNKSLQFEGDEQSAKRTKIEKPGQPLVDPGSSGSYENTSNLSTNSLLRLMDRQELGSEGPLTEIGADSEHTELYSSDFSDCSTVLKDGVTKEKIVAALERVLHAPLSKKILTDITGEELTVLGRPQVEGTSRQLCHVIPFSFIKEIVGSIVREASSLEVKLTSLVRMILIASKSMSGFALREKDLASPEYKEISDIVKANKFPDRSFKVSSSSSSTESVYLISPSKQGILFSTPRKMTKAKREFADCNNSFIKAALNELIELVKGDHNAATITAELLSRYLFTLFSIGENTIFAPEGNTMRYEIRLYNNKEDAKKAGDAKKTSADYQIVTAREMEEHINAGLNERIRIVDCEGSAINQCKKALGKLKSIITEALDTDTKATATFEELINEYNSYYNKPIKLANYTGDINVYNKSIVSSSYKTDAEYQLAKILYLAFDLRALEEVVFVPMKKGVKVYSAANGTRVCTYGLKKGDDYRDDKVNSATGYSDDSFFRCTEKDLEILPQKIAELFLIGTAPFLPYAAAITEFLNNSLDRLIELAAFDYCMQPEAGSHFKDQVHEAYGSLTHSTKDPLFSNITSLEVYGEDAAEINALLGQVSLAEESLSYA
ncbi:MAG: hypothetical protein Tsb006_4330 [Rickettsiaceae bacterium]